MPTGRTPRRRGAAGGFTYVGLLVLLAIMALVGAAGLKMGTLLQRAAAEDELLDIGAAFSDALASYAAATPKGTLTEPPTLQDLLKDPRFPTVRRHLRKLFVDPITGKSDWGIVRLGEKGTGGIIGVYSLSTNKPLKVGNFDPRFQGFENKAHLSDWRFVASGQAAPLPPALVPAAGQAGQVGQPGQPGQVGQPVDPAQTPLVPVDAAGVPGTSTPPPAPPQAAPEPAPEPAAAPEPEPKEPPEAPEPVETSDPQEPVRPSTPRR